MSGDLLFNAFIFLVAVGVVVPLAGRFRLGSVLGYLLAGVVIGPFGFAFIENPEQVAHFAEFGIIMMLFLIGLELEPSALWRLRKFIIGLGGLQVAATSAVFTAAGIALGYGWQVSLACAMALALSSTALVLQSLQERGWLHTSAGESGFAVLLFQDIAVIPILLVLPLLAPVSGTAAVTPMVADLPAWLHALVVAVVVVAIILGGKYVARHVFRFIANTHLREVFTATSLALVVGITLLMQTVGVSPALGAFLAGAVLANSEYRHTLEADIQPFKGLLLGLFFVSIGMGMDFALLRQEPGNLAAAVAGLMICKALLLAVLGYGFGLRDGQNALFALMLAQGGEFAFVLFQYAAGVHLLDAGQAAFLILTVALSMAATPFLILFGEHVLVPRFMSRLPERAYDRVDEQNAVIIAGYGRFGQIVGRFLRAQGVKVTILESDPDQIEQIHKFGTQVYFGDASRLDLLQSAGAEKAKLLVVAVDNADKCLEIVRLAKANFPALKVFARARNRRHAYELDKAGADYFRREMFDASLAMAEEVMKFLGADAAEMHRKARRFLDHDEQTLRRSFGFFEQEPELISFSRQATGELERILSEDSRDAVPPSIKTA